MNLNRNKFLFLILLAAFLLRFPGIFDGLPAAYNSTEYYHAKYALSMGARQSLDPQIDNYDVYNPRLFIYPMLYQYLVLFEYAALYIIGSLVGVFKDSYDFAVRFLVDPSIFYWVGRLVNVFISLLTVASIYLVLRKIYDEYLARIAAVVCTLSYYFILASVQAVSDSCLLLFSTLTILFILKSYHFPNQKNLIVAAVFCGLAIATKYNAGVLLLLFPLLLWIRKDEFIDRKIKLSALILLTVAISFIIPNPYWLIRFSQFMQGFLLVSSQANQAISPEMGLNYWWEFSQIVKGELLIGTGFFIALFYYVFKQKNEKFIIAVVAVLTFLYVGSWQKKGIDYLYAVYPVFVILCSLLIFELWQKFDKKPTLKNTVLVLVLLPSLAMAVYQNILRIGLDTREQATQWILENVSKGEKICYDNYHYDLGVFDINRYTNYGAGASQLPPPVIDKLLQYKDDRRNVQFIPMQYKLDQPVKKEGSLFEQEFNQYARKTIDELTQENVRYLITNNWYYNTYLKTNPEGLSLVIKSEIKEFTIFYNKLFKDYKPIKSFKPDFWTNGPEIKIYALSQQ